MEKCSARWKLHNTDSRSVSWLEQKWDSDYPFDACCITDTGRGNALFLLLSRYRRQPRLRVNSATMPLLLPCQSFKSQPEKRKEQHATPHIRTRVPLAYLLNVHPLDFEATNLPFEQKEPAISAPSPSRVFAQSSFWHWGSMPTQYIATKSVPTFFCPSPQGRAYQQRSSKPTRGGEDAAQKFDCRHHLSFRKASKLLLKLESFLKIFPPCTDHRCEHHNRRLLF